jgi:hypothetical protein
LRAAQPRGNLAAARDRRAALARTIFRGSLINMLLLKK